MELIPFLIFAVIAFNIVRGVIKAGKNTGGASAKEMMRQLNAQNRTPNMSRYKEQSPTQRGRERLARQEQSPWNAGNAARPGAQIAANYLKKTEATRQRERKEALKNPIQRGRRGKNMDQNRHRTDEWGERGDSSLLSGRNFIILLVVGGAVIYALSKIPA